jgi:hypothetical protein
MAVAHQAQSHSNIHSLSAPPQFGLEVGRTMWVVCNSWGRTMVERIKSELSDKSYEMALAVCAACGFVSMLLAGTI